MTEWVFAARGDNVDWADNAFVAIVGTGLPAVTGFGLWLAAAHAGLFARRLVARDGAGARSRRVSG